MTTQPIHEIAHEKASAIYLEKGIKCEISKPVGKVRDDWPCIAYEMRFTKGNSLFKVDYHLGIGHVNWKKNVPSFIFKTLEQTRCYEIMQSGKTLAKSANVPLSEAAAILAQYQKKSPVPSEVLATVCSDALEAMQSTWEDWASAFGYDVDSIKAKEIWRTCRDHYGELFRILEHKDIVNLAELAREF